MSQLETKTTLLQQTAGEVERSMREREVGEGVMGELLEGMLRRSRGEVVEAFGEYSEWSCGFESGGLMPGEDRVVAAEEGR